jgi:hypothetical protein
MHERLGSSADVIEAQLARSVRNTLWRAYDGAGFVEKRRMKLPR